LLFPCRSPASSMLFPLNNNLQPLPMLSHLEPVVF
jgi:hypothetical protein